MDTVTGIEKSHSEDGGLRLTNDRAAIQKKSLETARVSTQSQRQKAVCWAPGAGPSHLTGTEFQKMGELTPVRLHLILFSCTLDTCKFHLIFF